MCSLKSSCSVVSKWIFKTQVLSVGILIILLASTLLYSWLVMFLLLFLNIENISFHKCYHKQYKPTIAETSPSPCKYSIILLLCVGSTRANKRDFITALLCSSVDRSSNSLPVNERPSVDSCSPNTPILLQMASAVA